MKVSNLVIWILVSSDISGGIKICNEIIQVVSLWEADSSLWALSLVSSLPEVHSLGTSGTGWIADCRFGYCMCCFDFKEKPHLFIRQVTVTIMVFLHPPYHGNSSDVMNVTPSSILLRIYDMIPALVLISCFALKMWFICLLHQWSCSVLLGLNINSPFAYKMDRD